MRQRRNSRYTSAGTRLLLCCAVLGPLPACESNGSDTAFDAGLGKLRAALSLSPPDNHTGRPAPPPASMQLSIAASGLEGLDILAFSGCAVQRNIVRRDTPLGRMAKPSQQLLLALEYLHLAPPCIRRLRGSDDALADRMRDAWQQQQAQLPALIFNATLGGDEYRVLWQEAPVQGDYPRVDLCETTSALHAIEAAVRRWLDGDYRAQHRDFELWLAAVAGGTGGKLLHPVTALEAQLDAVLPPSYKRWRDDRNQRVSTLADTPSREPQQRELVPPSCAKP